MATRPSGHLQVKGRRGRRSYYALWRDAQGRHQLRLGPAHVRDSGRVTARGATIWRAGDGPKPDDSFLTPSEAEERLRGLLAGAPRISTLDRRSGLVTFADACAEWLRYLEHDRLRAPSTLADYRNAVRSYLLPAFGEEEPLERITTQRIDAWREYLLEQGRHSPRTVQKLLVLLHGILKRAKRRGWIAVNPAEDAERVSVQRSGDFNVLRPEEVLEVARVSDSEQLGALIVTAAFTGLRLGELRALRWGDVEIDKRLVHVRRSYTHGKFGRPKSQRVRSVPLVDQAIAALDPLTRREHFVGVQDLVFVSERGEPVDDAWLRDGFYRGLSQAGLGGLREKDDPMVFHDLRHTFGTLAVQVFPLSDVKAYMGHADISTTMLYVHHVPQHDAASKLSAVLSPVALPR